MNRIKKYRHALIPISMALYPPLLYFSRNSHLHSGEEMFMAYAWVLLMSAAAWCVGYMAFRNARLASVSSGTLMLLLLSNGHFREGLQSIGLAASETFRLSVQAMLHVVFIATTYLVVVVARRKRRVQDGLLLAGLLLVLFPLYDMFSSASGNPNPGQIKSGEHVERPAQYNRPDSGDLPNVLLFVLDGYGRADMLHTLYDVDNTDFIDALRNRGFIVPASSRANYSGSIYSLCSMFDMNYLWEIEKKYDVSLRTLEQYRRMFEHAELWRILKSFGYRTISFNTDNIITMRESDLLIDAGRTVEERHEHSFENQTSYVFMERMARSLGVIESTDEVGRWRRIIETVISESAVLAQSNTPTFVYGHVICPHPGFVLAREGERTVPFTAFFSDGADFHKGNNTDTSYYIQAYAQQVPRLNDLVLDAVDNVLSSNKPVAIIIMSDHGPGAYYDLDDLEQTNHWERHSNFVAVRSPDGSDMSIPDNITLINLFPVLLHEWYGISMTHKDDHVYRLKRRSRSIDPSIDFLDITYLLDSIDSRGVNRKIE